MQRSLISGAILKSISIFIKLHQFLMKSSRELTNEVIRDQSIRFKIVSDYQSKW